MRTARYLVAVAAGAILGCSDSRPYKTAAVSGRVTLDGKPLAKARVSFHPAQKASDGPLSGPESYGETDADGNYSLTTVFKDKGASVGRNRVMITTLKMERPASDPEEGKFKMVSPEKVPAKYSTEKAPLYFDVPAGGTNAANFELTTR